MTILESLRQSIKSIDDYKQMIDNHKSSKNYGNDIVSKYNEIGTNIEDLTSVIDRIFSDDKLYEEHFESDDKMDTISSILTEAFNKYAKLIELDKCEEKVALAFEWLFEVMLFTTDDEELKARITQNSNGIKVAIPNKVVNFPIKNGDKVKIEILSGAFSEKMVVNVEEIVDDYIYAYLGDREREEDLIIFSKDCVLSRK